MLQDYAAHPMGGQQKAIMRWNFLANFVPWRAQLTFLG